MLNRPSLIVSLLVLTSLMVVTLDPSEAHAKKRRSKPKVVEPAIPDNQEFPLSEVLEDEAQDVEVCQDLVCSRLREEILVEASKCRPLASFKRRRMHVRRKIASNSCRMFRDDNYKSSKGKCSAAVRQACERSGIDGKFLAENAYNLQKKGMLEKAGFVNMIWKYDERNAPLGAILTYVGGVGHRYGHIEVRVNPNLYCSDHCTDHPVTGVSPATKRGYKLAGVYLPFSSSIQISAYSGSAESKPVKN